MLYCLRSCLTLTSHPTLHCRYITFSVDALKQSYWAVSYLTGNPLQQALSRAPVLDRFYSWSTAWTLNHYQITTKSSNMLTTRHYWFHSTLLLVLKLNLLTSQTGPIVTNWKSTRLKLKKSFSVDLACPRKYFPSPWWGLIDLVVHREIIIIISTTVFMVLSSWQSHCESSPGSFDECRNVPLLSINHKCCCSVACFSTCTVLCRPPMKKQSSNSNRNRFQRFIR